MVIDAHTHGWHVDRGANGKPIPPLMPTWGEKDGPAVDYVKKRRDEGLESVVILDPPEITFKLHEMLGDFIIPVPQVDLDSATPDDIDELFGRGARGIKFIAPMKFYGHDDYLPIYGAVLKNRGLAVFHTGYVILGTFEPGGVKGRKAIVDINDMRPSALDRIGRAFPDLKILMSHFGNPWWEEAWKMVSSHKNIYADLCGGTAYLRDMDMWGQIFAPNGVLDVNVVSKLCFASDGTFNQAVAFHSLLDFYKRLLERLKVPDAIQKRIYRENILKLVQLQ